MTVENAFQLPEVPKKLENEPSTTQLWVGTRRQRIINGSSSLSQPFVKLETVRSTLRPLTVSQLHIGITGEDKTDALLHTAKDPIRMYRALHIIDQIDTINNPYTIAYSAYTAADPAVYRLGKREPNHRLNAIIESITSDIDEGTIREIHKMLPPDIEKLWFWLEQQGTKLDAASLFRELKAGNIQDSWVYKLSLQDRYTERYNDRLFKSGKIDFEELLASLEN